MTLQDENTMTQSTNCPPLPLDLIAEIFDRLCGNKETLAACSLVCKSWTHLAHYRLFEDVTIDYNTGLERLRGVLKEGPAAMAFIQCLSILSLSCSADGSTEAVLYNELIPQLNGLERIRSLSLENFAWRMLEPEVKSAFLAHFLPIVRLQLGGVGFFTFSDLEMIIRAFPRLETLVFSNDLSLLPGNRWPSAICFPHNIRGLELQVTHTNAFLKWLLSFPTTPVLRKVYLHRELPKEIDSFLQELGPSLEVLRCDAYGRVPPNLRHNTNLGSIHVKFNRSTRPQWISQLLVHIASEHMNDVVFELEVDRFDSGDPVKWRKVDEILAQPQFIKLTIVTVTFCCQSTHLRLPNFSTWAMTNMPLCRARGILNVRCDTWKEISL